MGAPLEAELRALAPLSVADFMEICNRHYYATRDPLGAAGDFTTAPEISQIFGEVIGAFIAHLAVGLEQVNLIEGGPGRGTLMADILRSTRTVPGFHEGLSVHMVETSPALKALQKTALTDTKPPISWSPLISELGLSNNPNLFIFNELFDALPSQHYVHRGGEWRVRLIDFKNGEWGFAEGEAVDIGQAYEAKEGDILELSPARTSLMGEVARIMAASGGVAIIIDYGPARWGVGDTLQALKGHTFANVLSHPGEADLTTHVDFGALADVAHEHGLYVHRLLPQGVFLDRLGGRVRAMRLDRESDYDRLSAPDQMGELFKVLIVGHKDWESRIKEVLP